MRERSVCVDPAGVFHECATYGLELGLEIDRQDVPTPVIPRFPKVASNGVRTLAIFKSGSTPNPGATWVVNNLGQAKELGVNHGVTSVWLRDLPDGTFKAFWIVDLEQYQWARLDGNLNILTRTEADADGRPIQVPDTGSGPNPHGYSDWLFFKGDDPMWTQENSPREVEGVLLHLPVDEGPWTVGQSNIAPPGMLAVNRETHMVYRIFTGDVQLPAHVALHGDELRVAVSSPTAGRILTQDDLTPQAIPDELPPLEAVPLLNRPFGLACYTFKNADTLGNIQLPIRPTTLALGPHPFIGTLETVDGIPDIDLFAIYLGEPQLLDEVRPLSDERQRGLFIYEDSYPMKADVMALAKPYDVLTPQVYRNQGEPLDHYAMRLRTAFMDAVFYGEPWPTVNIHRRHNEHGPTLSVKDVVDGFVLATQIAAEQGWPGMVLFRVGTSDMCQEVVPYLERFLSGITAIPEPRVIPEEPEPEEPDMPYVVLTKDAKLDPVVVLTKVTEIAHDGKTFLEKSNGRIVTITPDGGVEDRPPGTFGPWEEVIKSGKGYVADRGAKVFGIVSL